MESLKEVQEYLDSIPAINRGGCGIAALAIYRWLVKTNQIEDTKFVYLYREKESYLNNTNILRNKTGKACAPSHAVLLHEGRFIDSEGIKDISDYLWLDSNNR